MAPPASDEAMRLALVLREVRSRSGGKLLLFVPSAAAANAATSVADAAAALMHLHEGPVLIIDLRAGAELEHTPAWLDDLPQDDGIAGLWGANTTDAAAIARPFGVVHERGPEVASAQFSSRAADARATYPYVLCIGREVPASVETLMMAAVADGVVLTVPTGSTTRTDLQRVTGHLRRARANLIGFVADARRLPQHAPARRSGPAESPLRLRVVVKQGWGRSR